MNSGNRSFKRTVLLFHLLCLPLSTVSLFGIDSRLGGHRGGQQQQAAFLDRLSRIRAGSDVDANVDDAINPIVVYEEEEGGASEPQRAIILMDGFCRYHGMYLASRSQGIPGTAVIPVLSNYLYDFLMANESENAGEYRRMRLPQSKQEVDQWKNQLPSSLEIVGVYCESDSGLADAEILRKVLKVTCRDDPDELEARRHKYMMHESVREKTDLPVLKQKLCSSLQEAKDFARDLFDNNQHEYVVVKPYRGVASESVQLCQNQEEIESAFAAIHGSSVFGSKNRHEAVLVQEFLSGQEYAIDVVSRNGDHKVAAVWRYDKRPANGASFCYFQTRLVDASMDPAVSDICEYVASTLTALGIRYGLSHNEIMLTADRGPMLIEVNCRQHNMDFAPLTMACIGYNALDMTLVSMLGDDEDWQQFPDAPLLRGHGCMVHLVNFAKGQLKEVRHLDEMSSLSSFLDGEVYEYFLTPGEEIKPTIDIRSDAGWVQLINENEEDLNTDYKQIVDWMPDMFHVE